MKQQKKITIFICALFFSGISFCSNDLNPQKNILKYLIDRRCKEIIYKRSIAQKNRSKGIRLIVTNSVFRKKTSIDLPSNVKRVEVYNCSFEGPVALEISDQKRNKNVKSFKTFEKILRKFKPVSQKKLKELY